MKPKCSTEISQQPHRGKRKFTEGYKYLTQKKGEGARRGGGEGVGEGRGYAVRLVAEGVPQPGQKSEEGRRYPSQTKSQGKGGGTPARPKVRGKGGGTPARPVAGEREGLPLDTM